MEDMSNEQSGPARAQRRRKPRRTVAYPETLTVGVSAGWLAKLADAAGALGMSRAEYVRRCLRRGLDAARKRAANRGRR